MPQQEPIVFFWSLSAWATKITAYCALRGIPYSRCEQPIIQPRPDIAALGVRYRRVPIVAMGRDIYCDTLLIMQKLEDMYHPSQYKKISATSPSDRAMEKLLEKWTDVVVFKTAAAVISTDLDLLKDPQFQKDREALWGRSWSKEGQDKLRPAALADMRANFDFLEDLLSDGREWVLGHGPQLADIHACWIFDWLMQLPGSFPEDFFNTKRYPHAFAWCDRYNAAVAKAKESMPQPAEIEGHEAVAKILALPFNEDHLQVDDDDPSGLQAGQEIQMTPIDTGYSHSDVGKLIGLSAQEAVISARSQQGGNEIRIHYPRWNYTFTPVPDTNGKA